MNLRLHTICPQKILQGITTLTKNRENMPHTVSVRLWNDYLRITYLIYI